MTRQPLPNNLPPISETVTIDKDAILTKAMTHPGLAPKRKPNLEQACKVALAEVEIVFLEQITAYIEPQLEEIVGAYKLQNGEREESLSGDDWDSGLDDQFENMLEPWNPWLSADWLGKYTIDSGLHEDGETSKMATRVAREIWKQATSGKTINQQLSSAGIVQTDVELYLEQHLASAADATTTENTDVLQENKDELNAVLSKIKAHLGDDFDQMEVYGDFELALDEDEILSNGAAERLGIHSDETDILAMILQDIPSVEDAAQHLVEELAAAVAAVEEPAKPAPAKAAPPAPGKPTAPPPPPRPAGAAPTPPKPGAPKVEADKPAPAKAAPKAAAKGGEATSHNQVMALFKQHGTAWGDTAMAEKLGVSRSTLNNYINGKTACELDYDQTTAIREDLVAALNGLHEALGLLDGEEPTVIE